MWRILRGKNVWHSLGKGAINVIFNKLKRQYRRMDWLREKRPVKADITWTKVKN